MRVLEKEQRWGQPMGLLSGAEMAVQSAPVMGEVMGEVLEPVLGPAWASRMGLLWE